MGPAGAVPAGAAVPAAGLCNIIILLCGILPPFLRLPACRAPAPAAADGLRAACSCACAARGLLPPALLLFPPLFAVILFYSLLFRADCPHTVSTAVINSAAYNIIMKCAVSGQAGGACGGLYAWKIARRGRGSCFRSVRRAALLPEGPSRRKNRKTEKQDFTPAGASARLEEKQPAGAVGRAALKYNN